MYISACIKWSTGNQMKLIGAPFCQFCFFFSGPYLGQLHVLVYVALCIISCHLNIFIVDDPKGETDG